jgi:hypothetical protein
MPSTVSTILAPGRVTPTVVYLDNISQDAFISATAYEKAMGPDTLRLIWDRGVAVYEVQEWRPGSHRMVQIVAKAQIVFNLASVGQPPYHVEILVLVYEDRNDSAMSFLPCSFLQRVFGAHIAPIREQRRSDPFSQAYFAITSRDTICSNVVLGTDTDLGHISSESDDDPAQPPRAGGRRAQQRPQGGAATLDSDSDDDYGGRGPSTGGSARQRPQGGSAVATSPPSVRHGARPVDGHTTRRDTGTETAIPPTATRDNRPARTARALTPDSRCYVCTGKDKSGSRLSREVCYCGLAVHADCIQKWINASTNNHGQVIIHSRDTCSACKGKLDMQEIDRMAREDRRERGAPNRLGKTETPAPIRRAIENCTAAVRHRMVCNTTSAPAVPYRINTSPSDEGGLYAAQPQPLGPVPGTEGVPRTIPNVVAHQEARDSRRLGRITAAPSTRNNQDWRRGIRSAAVGQAQELLARGVSEQRAEETAEWTRNYLSNNTFAIDPSAFPYGDATGEQPSTVSTRESRGPRQPAAASDTADHARPRRNHGRSTGFAWHDGVMNWRNNAIANGSAGLDGAPRDRVVEAVDAFHDTMAQTAPSNVTSRSLPHGRGGDENLFNTEQREQVGGNQDNEAGNPYSPSLLRREAPRLHGTVRQDTVSAPRTDDALALGGASRPARPPESSGAPLVRRALRHIMITNSTESRSERNLRRANHVGLQNALDALGAADFAFYADRIVWQEEWKRQSLARAPKRLPDERAAE